MDTPNDKESTKVQLYKVTKQRRLEFIDFMEGNCPAG